VRPSLEDHITPLLKPLIDKLITALCSLSRLASTGQEDPPFLVLDGHEVCRDLYVDHVGAIGMSAEVVHKEVVRVVDEEMKCIDHFPVVSDEGHLDRLFHNLGDSGLSFRLLLEQLHLHLLLALLEKEFSLTEHLLAFLECLVDEAGGL